MAPVGCGVLSVKHHMQILRPLAFVRYMGQVYPMVLGSSWIPRPGCHYCIVFPGSQNSIQLQGQPPKLRGLEPTSSTFHTEKYCRERERERVRERNRERDSERERNRERD